jgi:hypothetical protein
MELLNENAGAVQAFLVLALVAVTMYYAWQARKSVKAMEDSAEAAKEQAEASRQMVGQAEKDLHYRFLPVLFPQIIKVIGGQEYTIVDPDELYNHLLLGPVVRWRNRGTGVAINARFSFCGVPKKTQNGERGADSFSHIGPTSLGVGDPERVHFALEGMLLDAPLYVSEGYQTRLRAEYVDIFKNNITAVQTFRVDEDAMQAFRDEFYFEVNGERFGEKSKD